MTASGGVDSLARGVPVWRLAFRIAERQQQALVSHQVAIFSELTKQTEPNISEQQRLRKIRDRLLLRIAEAIGKKDGSPSLTHVITMSVEPLQSELKARQLLIRDALDRLRIVQERNQALLRQGVGIDARFGERIDRGY